MRPEIISRYLVRYGAPGFVGWFGTVHAIDAPRGAQVVVASDRGMETGEVLLEAKNASAASDAAAPTGELLRRMTAEDARLVEQLREKLPPLLEQCRRLLAERNIPVAIVDGEVLLDAEHAVIYFAGEPTEKLGPLAVELGRTAPSLHIQFQTLDAIALQSDPGAEAAAKIVDAPPEKLSRQETIKAEAASRWPQIARELEDAAKDKFPRDDAFLLQLHGVYQQEDRDAKNAAVASRKASGPVAVPARRRFFMVRTRPPGGRLTARQLLVHLELADRFGDGTLRITSRQGLQLHGVAKGNIRSVLQEINASLLTTLGACGDVSRNVMCCPAPLRGDRLRTRLQTIATEIARHFTPQSSPYYEIWLDEEPYSAASSEEPVYGATYLPRKFKTALALPEDNCVDVFTQDIGLLAEVEDGRLAGFNVLVGGGLGVTPGRDDTFPRLAEPLAFVAAGEELRVLDAIVRIHRNHSNRRDRRRARLKYLVADLGISKFKAAVGEVLERELAPPKALEVSGYDDHLGWRPQGDGLFFLGLPVPSGRISDAGDGSFKAALRTALARFQSPVRLTAQQNLILCDLPPERQSEVETIFHDAGVPLVEYLSPLRRHFLACPALPTCGLALAEAERMAPELLSRVEQEMQRLRLADEPITFRISGCPSGCARSATADVALVGRSPGRYAIYTGGWLRGDRLNELWRDEVPQERLVEEIVAAVLRHCGDHVGVAAHSPQHHAQNVRPARDPGG
jgi:sulfite reductase (ferredoxin)